MQTASTVCGSCGFENPRAWRACSSCGRSLGSSFRPTGVTGMAPRGGDRTMVSSTPVDEAEPLENEEVSLDELEEVDDGEQEPPLIGQPDAAGAIQAGIDRAFSLSQPTLVALEGPRGSGKTRLLIYASEIAARLNDRSRHCYGVCREGGDGAYAPFSRLLLERFGVTPSSSPSAVRASMSTLVSSALDTSDVVRVTETAHLLGHIAGIPFPNSPVLRPLGDDPQELHRRACQAVARFFEGDASHRPILLMLDNMHLAETPAWDVVREITKTKAQIAVAIAGDQPVMERAASYEPAGGIAVGPIAPLEETAVQAMLYVLLPSLNSAPEPLVAAVTHRSGGNAAKVRELAFALWEAGLVVPTADGLEVDLERLGNGDDLPITMDDAVQARLERLDALELATLERAALIGEVFWDGAILAQMRADRKPPGEDDDPLSVWPDDEDNDALAFALERLERKGFIESIDQSDLPGAREYNFALEGTRDLLDAEIQKDSRVRRHAAVARWLALVGQLRREGMAARIAPHLEKAGQKARAGRAYLEAAAHERFQRRTERALRYINNALEMIPSEDVVRRIEALHEHGLLLFALGQYDDSIAAFTEMLQHAWKVGARGKGGAALNRIARAHAAKGEEERARRVLLRALDLFRSASDLRGVAATLDDMAQLHVRRVELDQGFACAAEALEIRRAHGDRRGEAVSLNTLGQLEYRRGNLEAAEKYVLSALEIRSAISDHEGALQCHNHLGVFAFERGDRERAVGAWTSALEQARALADRRAECFILNNIGEARSKDGAYDEAHASLQGAIDIAEDLGDLRAIAEVKRNLGLVLVRRGDDGGLDYLRQALVAAKEYGGPDIIALAHRALGEAHAQTLFSGAEERDESAEKSFTTSIELFQQGGNEREAARSLVQLGKHLAERGELETARVRLREARALFRRQALAADAARVDETLRGLGTKS
ncbi:MAG: tetratricopeptide repeat protein [Polyangiales bacterium]